MHLGVLIITTQTWPQRTHFCCRVSGAAENMSRLERGSSSQHAVLAFVTTCMPAYVAMALQLYWPTEPMPCTNSMQYAVVTLRQPCQRRARCKPGTTTTQGLLLATADGGQHWGIRSQSHHMCQWRHPQHARTLAPPQYTYSTGCCAPTLLVEAQQHRGVLCVRPGADSCLLARLTSAVTPQGATASTDLFSRHP